MENKILNVNKINLFIFIVPPKKESHAGLEEWVNCDNIYTLVNYPFKWMAT